MLLSRSCLCLCSERYSGRQGRSLCPHLFDSVVCLASAPINSSRGARSEHSPAAERGGAIIPQAHRSKLSTPGQVWSHWSVRKDKICEFRGGQR